ncbi:LytR/AlgR family response regulator transcription factor [Chitinophagaceae bacterium MMS25-I14]
MKTLLIDDAEKALVNLAQIIKTNFSEIFSEIRSADNVTAALELLATFRPDVIFLDIHLNGSTGFDFLNLAGEQHFKVIFVTAYDEYAIRALRLNAFDYLLKPIDISEFTTCINRLITSVQEAKTGTAPGNDVDISSPRLTFNPDYIIFKEPNGIQKVVFSNIFYLEAAGPYTNIVYFKNGAQVKIVKSKTLYDFEQLLPTDTFLRIHRSYIVNISNISRLLREKDKSFVVAGGTALPVSRRRFSTIEKILARVG